MVRTAIISGAGIAGLAAGLGLALRGHDVEVWERAAELNEVGAGLQLSPNAMHALRALGVEDAVEAVATEPVSAVLRHHATGRPYLTLPLQAACRTRYGAPYFHIHRADLHRCLAESAIRAGAKLRLGNRVTDHRGYGDGVEVTSGAGEVARADFFVGADGARSSVRTRLLGRTPPRFTGQVAWRGLVPRDRLAEGAVPRDATVWAGPGRHLVTYWIRGGDLLNVVAVQERDDWQAEGWMLPGDPAELRAAFAGWHPTVQAVLAGIEQTYLWALFDRTALTRWHDERTVLIGDACHPTLPFLAQGAAMGLEDAVALASMIDRVPDLEEAFRTFEELRKPRTSRLQAQARRNAGLFHLNEGPMGLIARAKLAISPHLRETLAWRSFDWIYGYDPRST